MMSLVLAYLAGASSAVAPAPTRSAVAAFANCVVTKHPAEARRFVLHQYGSNWQGPIADFRKLKDGGCISSQGSKDDARALRGLSEDGLKIALADVLVRRDLAQFDAALITNAQQLSTTAQVDGLWTKPEDCKKCDAKQLEELAKVRSNMTARLGPHIFSECAVHAEPAKVHQLLMTDRGSGAEQQAFDALGPAFGQCIAPDQKLSVTKTVLRDFLGLTYYRVANAPRAAVQAQTPGAAK